MPDIQRELGNVSSCLIWVGPKPNTETRILMKVVNLGSDSRELQWEWGKGAREGARPIKDMLMRRVLLWAALAPPCWDLPRNRVQHACQWEGTTVCHSRQPTQRGWGEASAAPAVFIFPLHHPLINQRTWHDRHVSCTRSQSQRSLPQSSQETHKKERIKFVEGLEKKWDLRNTEKMPRI